MLVFCNAKYGLRFIFIANRGTINNGEHDDMRGAKVGARKGPIARARSVT
jgi:hypothetical protein